MCGRYTLATPAEELVEAFDVGVLTFDWFARFNIAPGQDAPVVAEDRRGRRMGLLNWGLVPSWQDESGRGLINARAESVATKPSFREAYARRRCLIPADGFYEWRRPEKQPFWIHPAGGSPIAFAGLWETWRRPGAEPRHGFTIITTGANREVGAIHDRMPVTVDPKDHDAWLDSGTTAERVATMLRTPDDGSFLLHAVSRRVNRVSEDDAELVAQVAGEDSPGL